MISDKTACRSQIERCRVKGLGLNCTIDPTIPQMIQGDPTRISHILYNLLSNAVKFTNQGCISVEVNRPQFEEEELIEGKLDEWMTISVKDTGIGMNKNHFLYAKNIAEMLDLGANIENADELPLLDPETKQKPEISALTMESGIESR